MINFCLFSPPSKKINKYFTLKNYILHVKKLFLHKMKVKEMIGEPDSTQPVKIFPTNLPQFKMQLFLRFSISPTFLVTKWIKATSFFLLSINLIHV